MRNFEFEYLIHQLRAYANQHEQPPYGRSIEGEEELERNAADAIKFLLEENKKLQKENKKLRDKEFSLETNTPIGTLFVEPSSDPEYPGFWIVLKRNGIDKSLALVECDTTDNSRLFALIWGNEQEDYTHKIAYNGIEEYFERMEEDK